MRLRQNKKFFIITGKYQGDWTMAIFISLCGGESGSGIYFTAGINRMDPKKRGQLTKEKHGEGVSGPVADQSRVGRPPRTNSKRPSGAPLEVAEEMGGALGNRAFGMGD